MQVVNKKIKCTKKKKTRNLQLYSKARRRVTSRRGCRVVGEECHVGEEFYGVDIEGQRVMWSFTMEVHAALLKVQGGGERPTMSEGYDRETATNRWRDMIGRPPPLGGGLWEGDRREEKGGSKRIMHRMGEGRSAYLGPCKHHC